MCVQPNNIEAHIRLYVCICICTKSLSHNSCVSIRKAQGMTGHSFQAPHEAGMRSVQTSAPRRFTTSMTL